VRRPLADLAGGSGRLTGEAEWGDPVPLEGRIVADRRIAQVIGPGPGDGKGVIEIDP
jgi:hypothetical protein